MTHPQSSAEWDERYSEKERMWSGNPNEMLLRFADQLGPQAKIAAPQTSQTAHQDTAQQKPAPQGTAPHTTKLRALDVGCGEGADAIWLAQNGWKAHGIDLSAVAIERAKVSADVHNFDASFEVADAIEFAKANQKTFDLVTVFFLHSRDDEQRAATMRAIPDLVKPGGQLLVVSHAAMPPWSRHHHHEDGSPRPTFDITARSEIAELGLGEGWQIEFADELERPATGPDGEEAHLRDAVVLARRSA